MSERSERLRDAIGESGVAARSDARMICAAICEELGVTEEVVSALIQGLSWLVLSDDNTAAECDAAGVGIEAIATLLEASKP